MFHKSIINISRYMHNSIKCMTPLWVAKSNVQVLQVATTLPPRVESQGRESGYGVRTRNQGGYSLLPSSYIIC